MVGLFLFVPVWWFHFPLYGFLPFQTPSFGIFNPLFFRDLLPWLHATSQSCLLPQNLLASLFAFSAPSSSRFAHAKPINGVTTRFLVGNPQYGSFDIRKGKIFRTDPPGANHFWAIEQVRTEAQCGFFAFSADSLSRLFCHVCIYSYLCTIIS